MPQTLMIRYCRRYLMKALLRDNQCVTARLPTVTCTFKDPPDYQWQGCNGV